MMIGSHQGYGCDCGPIPMDGVWKESTLVDFNAMYMNLTCP